jgi:hypothetical protein
MESLADPVSTLFMGRPEARIWGSIATGAAPYLSLSGTSMAAPVVSATAALMLQVNPALTPGAVKRILQDSAEPHAEYNALAQGAGFLDARAAVELSRDLVGLSEAMVALEGAGGAYGSDVPGEATACEGTADCSTLTEPCTADAGCDDRAPAGLTGLSVSPQEIKIWAAPAERSTRRRIRATRRKQRPKESSRRGSSHE